MARLVKDSHLIDVNLVIPESQVKTLAKLKWLLGPIVGIALLGATITMHLSNAAEVERLTRETRMLSQTIAALKAADTEDLVGTYRQLIQERDDLRALVEKWRAAIPNPPDWRQRYADVLTPLPGVGGFAPSISLSALNASSSPLRKREDYGISSDEYARIYTEFTLGGTAKTKEDVTTAALAFGSSPRHAVIFTGTSASGDGYSFNLTVGLVADPPLPDPAEGEEKAAAGKAKP